jgi:hypothetical protein
VFYSVKKVEDHPCFEMQELLCALLYSATQDTPFSRNIFPAGYNKKSKFDRLGVLKDEFKNLHASLMKLDQSDKRRIYSQIADNNMIQLLCENSEIIPESNLDWKKEEGIEFEIKQLVAKCYKKLDLSIFRRNKCKLKPTHRYYRDYIKINKIVCPFCSIVNYKNPYNPRREDFDHYLCKSKYPLAAANMNNLVPMCSECNQDFKKSQDLLYEAGNRVVAFYPFSSLAGVSIVVKSTVSSEPPFMRTWSVDLLPNDVDETPKVDNWKRVFSIESRMVNELIQHHEEWMQQALDEMGGEPFKSERSFICHMKSRVTAEAHKVKRREAPGSQLRMEFYKYMSNSADDIFIESYIKQHNKLIENEANSNGNNF